MALYAIVPAAGLSRRMGQPKLLMKIGGRTVIERLLESLSHPEIVETVVVFRQDDEELAAAIDSLSGFRVECVRPESPPEDMRASVEYGLESLRTRHDPGSADGWALIPADHPILDSMVVEQLIAEWRRSGSDVLVPVYQGRKGHPTIFRWSLAERVSQIPRDCGLNWLLAMEDVSVDRCTVESDSILLDVDTPEDFERLVKRLDQTS